MFEVRVEFPWLMVEGYSKSGFINIFGSIYYSLQIVF